MNRYSLIVGCFAALLLIGCDAGDDTTTTTPDTTTPVAPVPAPETPVARESSTASPATAPATAPSDPQAQLNQVMQYIKENKLDLAEKTLAQLESNKASLPASVADQLPRARTMLNGAKTGGGIKLPSAP